MFDVPYNFLKLGGGKGRSLLNAIVGKNFKKTQSDLSQLSMEEYSKVIFQKQINTN